MNPLNQFKLWSSIVIWILALVGGLLPAYVKDSSPRTRSLLNMFAGGIFLAGAVMHLLPDAVGNRPLARIRCSDAIDTLHTNSCENNLYAYFFFGAGFLLILLFEVFAHELERFTVAAAATGCGGDNDHCVPCDHTPLMVNNERREKARQKHDLDSECSRNSLAHAHAHGLLGDEIQVLTVVVFISLSFHAVMDGVAIGSQVSSGWDIFFAVLAHKGFAAFALGLELTTHNITSMRLFWSMLVFSLMTPFGIFIGWLVVGDTEEESAASGICAAISAGTFLFVAVMETIPQELQNREDQYMKSTALCLGFILFGILAQWT